MSDEDSDTPSVSFFSKRAKLVPKKTPEELKAAEELVKKIEDEKNAQMDEEMPLGNDAESFGNKAGSSGKKGRKKKIPPRAVEDSQADASSHPCTCSHSATSSRPCKHSESPTSSVAASDKILDRELDQTRLSAAARKRLKKLKDDQELDLMLIEAKNAMILEGNPFKRSDVTEELPTVEEEKIFHVTVSYLSKVARFKCYENEKFFKVFKDVGDFFQLKPTEFLLCLNDRNIAVTDTPKSLCLSELDMLECIPYKPDFDLPSTSAHDDDSLTITFQSNDSKSKIDLVVNRMEKMQVIMEQYAKKRKMPLNEFTFEFDGEKLLGTETPAELDMETCDCIDVRVFMPLPQCSRASDDRPQCSRASDDRPQCSRASDDRPQCSRASDDRPQCSRASDVQPSDDQPSAKNDYFTVYFQDFTFVDSDDSDVIALD